MKALVFALFVLGSLPAAAKRLVVVANIAKLPDSAYAVMPKGPPCDRLDDSGDMVVCTAEWTRYRLTAVTRLNGAHLADTIALLFADPALGGRWRLELKPLEKSKAHAYGARYQVVSAVRATGVGGL